MNQKTKLAISSLVFVALFALSINAFAVFTPPTSNPGGGNIETPLNSGDALQSKAGGGLVLGYLRILGLTLIGGNLEVAGTVKILGGAPGLNKVLVSDDVGIASWVDPSTLPGWGGTPGTPTPGVIPVSGGGTGLTTIPAHSIWVANTKDVVSTVTTGAGQSVRLNTAGTAWESFTPLTSNGSGGTPNTISKFIGAHTLGDSNITDDGNTIKTGADFKVGGNLIYSNVVVPVTSDQNNLAVGEGTNIQINPNATPSTWVIHGIAPSGSAHIHGRVIYVSNINYANKDVVIKNNSGSASAGNKIRLASGADLTLAPFHSIMLVYDTNGANWRQVVSSN